MLSLLSAARAVAVAEAASILPQNVSFYKNIEQQSE
jgi:hypothetical protein